MTYFDVFGLISFALWVIAFAIFATLTIIIKNKRKKIQKQIQDSFSNIFKFQ